VRHKLDMGTQTIEERDAGAVAGWRRRQLLDSGFPRPLATRIAGDPRYDLHALIELVERGCNPELAARILRPIDEAAA
jgi:hypothetical protein